VIAFFHQRSKRSVKLATWDGFIPTAVKRSQYTLGHRIEIAARRVKVHQSWSDFTVRLSRSNYGCAD
jgi:hypothetical protein